MPDYLYLVLIVYAIGSATMFTLSIVSAVRSLVVSIPYRDFVISESGGNYLPYATGVFLVALERAATWPYLIACWAARSVRRR